jgi:serine/threonine-protein kinase HipA
MVQHGRWALSPAYDLNPVPEIDRARVNKMPLSEDAPEPSVAAALDVAPRFGIRSGEATKVLRQVFNAVSKWRETARSLHINAATLAPYETAFEHELMEEARVLLKSK